MGLGPDVIPQILRHFYAVELSKAHQGPVFQRVHAELIFLAFVSHSGSMDKRWTYVYRMRGKNRMPEWHLSTYEERTMSNEIPTDYDSGDAVATAPKHVIEYNITDAALAELAERHKDVDAHKDYDTAKLAAKECQQLRKGLEEKRVELKKDALEYGRAVDGEANRIKTAIVKVEDPIKEGIKAIDDAEKIKEDQRLATLEAQLAVLRAYGTDTEGKTLAELQTWQDDLATIEITEEIFQEAREQAVGAKAESESRLRIAITRKQAAEEEAAALEQQRKAQQEQQDKLDAQQAEIEEGQRKLREAQEAADQKAFEADLKEGREAAAERQKEREEQDAKDLAQQAEIDKRNEELDAKQAEIDKQEREEREKAQAAAELARSEELAPDKEKLERLAKIIDATELPTVASQQAEDVLSYVKSELKSIADNIRHYAGELK